MGFFKDMTREDWQGLTKLVIVLAIIGFVAWAVINPNVIPAVQGVLWAFVDLIRAGWASTVGG